MFYICFIHITCCYKNNRSTGDHLHTNKTGNKNHFLSCVHSVSVLITLGVLIINGKPLEKKKIIT